MNIIRDQIVIMLDSYNLKRWNKILIEKCIKDNPNQSLEYIAQLLGVSERGLRKKVGREGIKITKRDRKMLSYILTEELEKISTFKQK